MRESINHLKLIWQSATFAFGGKGVIFVVNFLPVWKHSGNSSSKNTDQMRWKDVKPHLESKKKPGLCLLGGLSEACTEQRIDFYRYGGHIEFIRFKEYYGMPRGTRSVFTRAFRSKRELQCTFLRKKVIILYPNRAQPSFFPIKIFF